MINFRSIVFVLMVMSLIVLEVHPSYAYAESSIKSGLYLQGPDDLASRLTPRLQTKSSANTGTHLKDYYMDSDIKSGISYTVKSEGGGMIRQWWYDRVLSPDPNTNTVADKLIIEFTGNVRYVGANFTGTTLSGEYKSGTRVTVTVFDRSGGSHTFSHNDSTELLYLIESTNSISRIEVESTGQFSTIANIVIGSYFNDVPEEYTISTTVNNAAYGTVTGGGTYLEGVEATLGATASTGYEFDNWTENGSPVSCSQVCVVTANKDYNLVANFKPIDYSITYHIQGGTNNQNNPTSYTIETEPITLGEPIRAGYTFNGWFDQESDGYQVIQIRKGSTGNKILWAKWAQNVDYVAVTAVAGIYPVGVTYDSTTGKFTVPTDVNSFTFKDGNKEMKATKGANGEWIIEEVDTVTPPSYDDLFTIQKPTGPINNSKPEISGTVDMTTTPSTVTIELKNSNNETILVDGIATVHPVSGVWTFTPPTDLPNGTYTIIATATNGTDTVVKTHTFTVTTMQEVDKTKLQNKVDESNNLVSSNYTPESWAQYQTALQKANEVLADPDATQEEVNNALASLTAAQNALVQVAGKGLSALTPSTGSSLSPSFQTNVTDYTMNVGYPTNVISFTAIPVEAGATVTTTVNGRPGTIEQIPLQVGENIIVISVKDANGNVRQYTIKVYRQADTGGGPWTPNPTQPVTPTPSETKTKIQVELEIDGEKTLEKTTVEIERTKHANGDITDFVALTEANAKEAVAKAKAIGNDIARIVLPDVNDEVKEAKVEIPKESLKLLRDNGVALEISTENGHIAIPVSSMEGIDDNFYFRLVPVKKESERQAIEERARAERVVRATLQSNDVHVVARPMTIETNMPNRPVQVTLPLKGVKIPTDATEREAFLKQLAVFIEHSDGEKKVVIPEVVTMAKGELGLRFTVEKFSTFTIIQVNKEEETKSPVEVKEHEAYIKGFLDGTFGPEKNVTRAQVATMIARILGYTDSTVNTTPFKDIPSDHYAAGAIAFVKERGIMNGDVNGNFRAFENITRAQMAKVVANFKQLHIEENVAITFNDTKGHWAQWIIEANRTAGIINGLQDGSFGPNAYLTRAQAVVMMNRMFERGPLNGVTTPSFPDVKATHWAFKEIEEAAKSHSYVIDENNNEQLSK
ncbi:S-layer homology domain-containing protein [Lysinibacillus sp. NPDC047702]|uniref:S-layer homology domain-containing protein n=1 Tax=unclassified Lysinibacillus TaxID=2636778 RepID=UPI003D022AAE